MARRIIGLDLGAYSVKLVRLEIGKKEPKFEIIGVAEGILPLVDDGQKDLSTLQEEAILSLYCQGMLEADGYVAGLSSLNGHVKSMYVPFYEYRKIEAVLPGMLESDVPFDLNDMIIAWNLDGNQKLLPDGQKLTGIKVAFAEKSSIANSIKILQPYNVDPKQIHLSSVAYYELYRELNQNFFLDTEISTTEGKHGNLFAIIDFGHRATNVCIFNKNGLALVKSILKGGKKLTEEIAKRMSISFADAQDLKHKHLDFAANDHDENGEIIMELAFNHYVSLVDEIARVFTTCAIDGLGKVKSLAFVGGCCKSPSFNQYVFGLYKSDSLTLVDFSTFLAQANPSLTQAFAYALSLLQPHAKDSRFNFRKDEFVFRGGFEFVKNKSIPLTLWALILICSSTLVWYASSLVLDKENNVMDEALKNTCTSILKGKFISAQKCLASMKEQITANDGFGIPQFAASDPYIELAKKLPSGLVVVVTDLDIMENRVRIACKTTNFENVDTVLAAISQIECLKKVEKQGRIDQLEKGVKFQLTAEVDCTKTLPTNL